MVLRIGEFHIANFTRFRFFQILKISHLSEQSGRQEIFLTNFTRTANNVNNPAVDVCPLAICANILNFHA